MNTDARKKIIVRVGIVSICANLLLLGIKAAAAVLSGSDSMAGDCLHTLSDIGTTAVVLFGCVWAAKKADEGHPYGHEKLEYVAAMLLGAVLAFVGVSLIKEGIDALRGGGVRVQYGWLTVGAAAVSIAVKEGMYHYTRYWAVRTGSGALRADAWHHRSDALSSVGSLIGVACSMAGIGRGDSVAAIAIGALIVCSGVRVVYDSASHVDDHAACFAPVSVMTAAALSVEGIRGARVIRTRLHGGVFFAEMVIEVDANATVEEGCALAKAAHDLVEQKVERLKHLHVTVAPYYAAPQ